jgi:aryl-alcohol dehydrogenase-like predicted oxidoreductase
MRESRGSGTMQNRQLGTSEIEVSPIVFGAMPIGGWLWGGTDETAAIRTIQKCIDEGMTTIDTAPVYGFGLSEVLVGEAIGGRRSEVVLATKAGMRWDSDEGQFFFSTTDDGGNARDVYRVLKADSIVHECEMSLRRLRTETIDLYQCHWPDNTTPLDETMEAMVRLKEQGKIRAIGVSNFTAEMIDECSTVGPVASDQPRYSLLHREIESDVLPHCREHDVGLLVYNPFEMGILAGKTPMYRVFADDDQRSNNRWYNPTNRRRVLDALEKIRPIADGHGATLAQLAINWVVGEPGITSAIVGARSPEQVVENAGALAFDLGADERATIRKMFEELGDPE